MRIPQPAPGALVLPTFATDRPSAGPEAHALVSATGAAELVSAPARASARDGRAVRRARIRRARGSPCCRKQTILTAAAVVGDDYLARRRGSRALRPNRVGRQRVAITAGAQQISA
jgi:hypothetical protein